MGGDHHENKYEKYHNNSNRNSECHWTKELEKHSFKEPKLRNKLFWLKPLSVFHRLEYRGIDSRDKYEATYKDEWEMQIWNIPTVKRGPCRDYYVDFIQCTKYLEGHFTFFFNAWTMHGRYCWKPYNNYASCMDEFANHHPEYFKEGSNLGHH